MRAPDFSSSWLKCTSCGRTAGYSFTGTFTSPKLIEPLQIARAIATYLLAISGEAYPGRPVRLRAMPEPVDLVDAVVNLCKRRGFVFASAEIYGGFRSTYDYGPLGVLLLRNVKDAWWRSMVQLRDDVVGLDAAILSPPAIWEASGHLKNFTDPLVDCRNCKERFRLDQLDDPTTCPNCGKHDSFTEARQFNLMFKTHAG